MTFWRNTGSGLSTRHATYCLQEFHYMVSDSSNPDFQTSAPKKQDPDRAEDTTWLHSATTTMLELKSFIAQLATSTKPGQPPIFPSDVFLFPTGMNAIHTLSQTISSLNPTPTVVAYGWLYPETVDVLRGTRKTVLSYKAGNDADLAVLESLLESGQQVHALFCELPSNVTLSCPHIHRIRELADQYGFIVVCDDTVAGFVNVDLLPYVDVVVTSLTKGFSGASNVTGGRYAPFPFLNTKPCNETNTLKPRIKPYLTPPRFNPQRPFKNLQVHNLLPGRHPHALRQQRNTTPTHKNSQRKHPRPPPAPNIPPVNKNSQPPLHPPNSRDIQLPPQTHRLQWLHKHPKHNLPRPALRRNILQCVGCKQGD